MRPEREFTENLVNLIQHFSGKPNLMTSFSVQIQKKFLLNNLYSVASWNLLGLL